MSVAKAPRWLVPAAPRVDLASREGRVKALGEAARALLEGLALDAEVRVFLGAALEAWLGRGGSLERDYLKVSGPAGSHRTPSSLWRSSSRGGQEDGEDASLGSSGNQGSADDEFQG